MEDITLALITLTSFVLLFIVAIFADRAGITAQKSAEPVVVPVDDTATPTNNDSSVLGFDPRDVDVA